MTHLRGKQAQHGDVSTSALHSITLCRCPLSIHSRLSTSSARSGAFSSRCTSKATLQSCRAACPAADASRLALIGAVPLCGESPSTAHSRIISSVDMTRVLKRVRVASECSESFLNRLTISASCMSRTRWGASSPSSTAARLRAFIAEAAQPPAPPTSAPSEAPHSICAAIDIRPKTPPPPSGHDGSFF
eukprot:scaffold10787_cov123-Isochrysis_galbana.AAC.3